MSTQNKTSRVLFAERASLDPKGKLTWKLRCRGDQQVEVEEKNAIPMFGGESGLELHIRNRNSATFSYLRGEFILSPAECEGFVRFAVQLGLQSAPGVLALVGLYEEPKFQNELITIKQPIGSSDGILQPELLLNFNELPPRQSPVFGFVQICLPSAPGAVISVGQATALAADDKSGLKSLRIRFDAVGTPNKASSRLRVWKFVEALRSQSYDVRVGGSQTDVDIYFCQKILSFNALAAIRKSASRATVIYDFDDNHILEEQGVLSELLAFINHVDVVTCGSEYLAQTVRQWHPNVYVLENPLDISDHAPCRVPTEDLKKIGWFGAPEGLLELAKTDLGSEVTTITRGGDIEFDLRTIDAELVGFDLLVFPVEETPWNLAKNANRMLKALALGVPVLASATPEQRRIAELAGLPAECLVESMHGWKNAINRLRTRYPEIEKATLQSRERINRTHSAELIFDGLIDYLKKTTGGLAKPRRFASDILGSIAVFIVDGSPDGRGIQTLQSSLVHWPAFHSVHFFCAKKVKNELFHLQSPNFDSVTGDYLAVFAAADRAMEKCEAESFLIIPAGTALSYGFGAVLEKAMQAQVALFVRNEYCRPTLIGQCPMPRLPDLFLNPVTLGPLLVKSEWARKFGRRWESVFELWTWTAVVKALANDSSFAVVDLPFAFDALPKSDLSPSQQFAAWLEKNRPESARELPGSSDQWNRMLTDIIAETAADVGDDLPSIVAQLYSRYNAVLQKVATLETELRKMKKS